MKTTNLTKWLNRMNIAIAIASTVCTVVVGVCAAIVATPVMTLVAAGCSVLTVVAWQMCD